MKDQVGNEIAIGTHVCYPLRHGSHLRVKHGLVSAIRDGQIYVDGGWVSRLDRVFVVATPPPESKFNVGDIVVSPVSGYKWKIVSFEGEMNANLEYVSGTDGSFRPGDRYPIAWNIEAWRKDQ